MVRWKAPKTTQSVSIFELYQTGVELNALADECRAIQEEIWTWRRRVLTHRLKDANCQLAKANSGLWLKLRRCIHASVNRFWRRDM
jgi:hypothetical protein